jgi:hypothetical protein
MVRLWVEERLALGAQAGFHPLESAHTSILPDVYGNLQENKPARKEERAPHAVEEKYREHQVWHDESLFLRAGRSRSGMLMRGNELLRRAHLLQRHFILQVVRRGERVELVDDAAEEEHE